MDGVAFMPASYGIGGVAKCVGAVFGVVVQGQRFVDRQRCSGQTKLQRLCQIDGYFHSFGLKSRCKGSKNN